MSDTAPIGSSDLARRLGVHSARCEVVSQQSLSPSLIEVVLKGDAVTFAGVAGNDVMLLFHDQGGSPVRRRYSVRDVDASGDTFTLWASITHHGPAATILQELEPGDAFEVIGPRGKITLDPLADWHLFIGDVSALGAFYRMAQSIEAPGRCVFIVEIDDPSDALTATFDDGLGVTAIFVDRQGRANDDATGLLRGLAALTLPPDEGHAYLFGEFHVMRELRDALVDRGVGLDQISLKAFYRVGRANGVNGEPDKQA